jgi:hypothetical protein
MIRGTYFCFPYPKDPDETLDYQFDWSGHIGADLISSQVVIARGASLVATSLVADNKRVNLRISGGSDGTTAFLENTITTLSGQVIQRTAKLKISQR